VPRPDQKNLAFRRARCDGWRPRRCLAPRAGKGPHPGPPPTAAALGSADLAAALESCVSGWSQRRTALISQLSNVARLSALAASSYEETDAQLAAVLDKAMGNGTGAPG